jgi:hypothetical protein
MGASFPESDCLKSKEEVVQKKTVGCNNVKMGIEVLSPGLKRVTLTTDPHLVPWS